MRSETEYLRSQIDRLEAEVERLGDALAALVAAVDSNERLRVVTGSGAKDLHPALIEARRSLEGEER
jgi:phage terminase large subunit-like protein